MQVEGASRLGLGNIHQVGGPWAVLSISMSRHYRDSFEYVFSL